MKLCGSDNHYPTAPQNLVTDEYEISKTFNEHYINLAGKSCGNKPNKIGTTLGSLNGSDVIDRKP